ncbi:MAG TPA: hypothetical protein PKV53_04900, partial [Anaerohalosphaeraceae bacterium]|nr:hypothetical protein [Anaerohalosphaeraceae bacterium]
MAAGDTTSYDTIVGRMVVEQRLCTEEEVRRCLEELKERASSRPATLEQLLLEKQFLTPSQAARLQSMIRES